MNTLHLYTQRKLLSQTGALSFGYILFTPVNYFCTVLHIYFELYKMMAIILQRVENSSLICVCFCVCFLMVYHEYCVLLTSFF